MASRILYGGTLSPGQTLRPQSNKAGKMPMKSINTKANEAQASFSNEDDEGSDDAESSSDEDEESAGDVMALSGVDQPTVAGAGRLAGSLDDDHDMMSVDGSPASEFPATPMSLATDSQANTPRAKAGAEAFEDDDYAGVDEVSDDDAEDAEEDSILKSAEKDLIQEFKQTEGARKAKKDEENSFTANLFASNGDDIWAATDDDDPFGLNAELNMDEDPWQGASFLDTNWKGMLDNAENEISSWRTTDDPCRQDSTQSNSRPKRVRFQEGEGVSRRSSQSSSDSSDEADQAFPDIFMSADNPKIQRLLADDNDWDAYLEDGSVASAYDFEDDANAMPIEEDEGSDSEDSESSTDSEDDGDETEDESVEEKQAKMLVLRKAMQQTNVTAPVTPVKRTVLKLKRASTDGQTKKGPNEGTFLCDPTKATLTSDSSGRNFVVYMPAKPSAHNKAFWERARSAANSRGSSPRGSVSMMLPSRAKDDAPERPFTAQSTLSNMFDGNIEFMRNNDNVMPPPTLPDLSKVLKGSLQNYGYAMSTTTDSESDIEGEIGADFEMLINMDAESDTEVDSPEHVDSQPAFLQQGVVGSFRLNQDRAKNLSQLAVNPEQRASTAEQNALQTGRRKADPHMTPARKRRTSKDLDRTGSGIRKAATPAASSPLARHRGRSRGQSLSQTLSPGFPIRK